VNARYPRAHSGLYGPGQQPERGSGTHGPAHGTELPYLFDQPNAPFPAMSDDAPRNGQQSVLAVDAIALLDALGVGEANVGGFDWGARTANVMAALWPECGRVGYQAYRRDFARLIWRTASPAWRFGDATFERTAAAFDNRDHVAVVIHNYRWRLRAAAGEPRFDVLKQRLAAFPAISVPTITFEGDANGAPHPEPANYAARLTGKYVHRTLAGGIGHNLPQEAPLDFVHAIEEASNFT
jgi:pimeloyl-ACP methyl ester carboxylesterase